MANRNARVLLGVALAMAALAIFRPWTVRPIQTSQPKAFDATAYVAGAWLRVLDEAERTAVEIRAARTAAAAQRGGGSPSSRRPVFVRVTGIVTEVDRRSRVGVAYMRAGTAPPLLIAVQVGPVIRGTALRDAVPFLSFTDFSNQSEFAAVANALNDRVLRDVIGGLDLESLPGRTITVIGAAALAGDGDGRPVDLIPVRMLTGGGDR